MIIFFSKYKIRIHNTTYADPHLAYYFNSLRNFLIGLNFCRLQPGQWVKESGSLLETQVPVLKGK